MKRYFLLLPCLLLLQSCAPDEYAAQLAALVDTYSQQIARRLADEERRYRTEAAILQAADDRAQNMSSDEEIALAARSLAADINAGRAEGDRAISGATTFGLAEFERAKVFSSRSQDAELQRIRTLQSLAMDGARVQALRAALDGLSKKPNWQSALAESAAFGQDVKNHLDLLSCKDLLQAVTDLTAEDAKLTTAITAAAGDITKLAELTTRQTAVRASLKAATDGRAATGHFDAATNSCN